MDAILQAFVQAVRCELLSRHTLNASVVLWLVDLLHTLPTEVEVIWGSSFNIVKVLFLVNRYLPVDIVASYVYVWVAGVKPCETSYIFATAFYYIGSQCAEAVMYLRLYALSGRNKVAKFILMVQFAIMQVALIILMGFFLDSLEYARTPLPKHLPCLPAKGNLDMATAAIAVLITSEFIILGWTLTIAWKDHRISRSPLLTIFYRDGIIYFVALLGSSILNIILFATVPASCKTMFSIPSRIIHSILACRIILHLREQSLRQESGVIANAGSARIHEIQGSKVMELSEIRCAPQSTSFGQGSAFYGATTVAASGEGTLHYASLREREREMENSTGWI